VTESTDGNVTAEINGRQRAFRSGMTIGDLLEDLGLRPLQVVVERNGEPLEREKFAQTVMANGDRIEIAHMVGGG